MIRSMTGFGHAGMTSNGLSIQIDMKSVNHRYQEIMVRMPRDWIQYEDLIKKVIQQQIKRGRIEVFVTVEQEVSSPDQVQVNWALAEGYLRALQSIQERFGLEGRIQAKDVLYIPDIVHVGESPSVDEGAVEEQLTQCLNEALSQLLQMRETEGRNLYADLMARLQKLESYRQEITSRLPDLDQQHREKLRERIQELLSDPSSFDEYRFTMEVAIIAERANIEEELIRLGSHILQCRQLLDSDDAVGRKLDFLLQEMNREANTIASKSNHTDIVNLVVEIKAELEKIREQVQNIE